MNTSLAARPFVPTDLPADRIFIRACIAHVVAAIRPGGRAERVCAEYWPRDSATLHLVERGATAPATTSTTNWASQLAASSIGAFVGSLQESAAAQLIAAGVQFNMPGVAAITLPHTSFTGTPAWTAEGSPIPVAQATFAAPVLGPPHKLTLAEVFTREVTEATPQDAEAIVGQVLKDGMARSLDLSMFSATAADATRPAGLLAGVTPSTATVGGGLAAVLGDLRILIDATVAAGGSGAAMFFASPGRAQTLRGYAPAMAAQIIGSASIAGDTLVCVDPNAFASMFGADPQIEASRESVWHLDTAPAQIGTVGTPAVVAAPTRSMFQTDSIAFRAILRAAWAMRVPAVSFIPTGLSW